MHNFSYLWWFLRWSCKWRRILLGPRWLDFGLAISSSPPTNPKQMNNVIQYDGSNDDLDWRIDFRYLNFVCIIKYLRFRVIKGCFIEWKCLRLSNFNLQLDLIKTLFFEVLTYFNKSSGKFYIVLKKKICSIGPFL